MSNKDITQGTSGGKDPTSIRKKQDSSGLSIRISDLNKIQLKGLPPAIWGKYKLVVEFVSNTQCSVFAEALNPNPDGSKDRISYEDLKRLSMSNGFLRANEKEGKREESASIAETAIFNCQKSPTVDLKECPATRTELLKIHAMSTKLTQNRTTLRKNKSSGKTNERSLELGDLLIDRATMGLKEYLFDLIKEGKDREPLADHLRRNGFPATAISAWLENDINLQPAEPAVGLFHKSDPSKGLTFSVEDIIKIPTDLLIEFFDEFSFPLNLMRDVQALSEMSGLGTDILENKDNPQTKQLMSFKMFSPLKGVIEPIAQLEKIVSAKSQFFAQNPEGQKYPFLSRWNDAVNSGIYLLPWRKDVQGVKTFWSSKAIKGGFNLKTPGLAVSPYPNQLLELWKSSNNPVYPNFEPVRELFCSFLPDEDKKHFDKVSRMKLVNNCSQEDFLEQDRDGRMGLITNKTYVKDGLPKSYSGSNKNFLESYAMWMFEHHLDYEREPEKETVDGASSMINSKFIRPVQAPGSTMNPLATEFKKFEAKLNAERNERLIKTLQKKKSKIPSVSVLTPQSAKVIRSLKAHDVCHRETIALVEAHLKGIANSYAQTLCAEAIYASMYEEDSSSSIAAEEEEIDEEILALPKKPDEN